MTVGENNHPFEESGWPISVHDLERTQLANLVDSLCKQALDNESEHVIQSLNILSEQVSQVIDDFHVQLFAKVQAVIFFLSGLFSNAKTIIRGGTFEPVHHPFMQRLYRKIVQKKGKILTANDYCRFPPSIDKISEDGLPKSLCDYLDAYYHSKRAEKKALNVELVAKKTKMPVSVIEDRFAKSRLEYSGKRNAKREKKAKKEEESSWKQEMFHFESPDNIYNNPVFLCYPSPPVETCHRFPLARVPIDQPLTIQIPEDTPIYIPFY